MNRLRSYIRQHALVAFLLLAFGISWTAFLLDQPIVFVFGPSAAGVILVQLTYTPEARRDFWRRVLDFKRISAGWYLLFILIIPALLAASILLDVLLGGSLPQMPNLGRVIVQPWLLPLVVIQTLLQGALSEELGWRGYALDVSLKRWGALRSGLLIGLLWWAWHLPLFSWPSYGSAHYQWGWFTPMFWGFLFNVMPLGLLMTWATVRNRASILSAILIHFSFNFTLGMALPFSERVFFIMGTLLFLTVVPVIRLQPAVLMSEVSVPAGHIV